MVDRLCHASIQLLACCKGLAVPNLRLHALCITVALRIAAFGPVNNTLWVNAQRLPWLPQSARR